jgi:phosphoadenosine phosphosulfate reductase
MMMLSLSLFALASIQTSYAFSVAPAMLTRPSVTAMRMAEVFDQEQFNTKGKEMRLAHLEEQAMYALKISCENYGNAVFPNAMIAGDIVITDLLSRLGYLESGKAKIMVVDTFHLFPETMEFLKTVRILR